jgi:hypothetical protein
LICLFTFGLIPAMVVPDVTAKKVTERRAAQVNPAVLRFYNQRYLPPWQSLNRAFYGTKNTFCGIGCDTVYLRLSLL